MIANEDLDYCQSACTRHEISSDEVDLVIDEVEGINGPDSEIWVVDCAHQGIVWSSGCLIVA